MDRVMLSNNLCCNAVMVPCDVLDKHLKEANESQLKIYLYLLRNQFGGTVTVSSLADYFNYSERDVKRALSFWGLEKAVSEQDDNGGNVVNFNKKPSYTAAQLNEFASREDIRELLFVTEQYIGKKQGMMSPDFIASVLYMYDSLGLSKDLIINLFEYCAEHKKTKLYQIEAVADEWKDAGILSAEQIASYTKVVPKEVYEVFKAFGIKTSCREPIDSEIEFVRSWMQDLGYGTDIISEACKRTVMRIHEPSFAYANTVLAGWHNNGVKTLEDIKAADDEYNKRREEAMNAGGARSKKSAAKNPKNDDNSSKGKNNKFKNFEQREYDFAQLEKEALCH